MPRKRVFRVVAICCLAALLAPSLVSAAERAEPKSRSSISVSKTWVKASPAAPKIVRDRLLLALDMLKALGVSQDEGEGPIRTDGLSDRPDPIGVGTGPAGSGGPAIPYEDTVPTDPTTEDQDTSNTGFAAR